MLNKQMAPGAPIEARCTKCRKNTNHIVVAVVEDTPVKVQCNVCEGQHKYRPPTASSKKTSTSPSSYRTLEHKKWESLCGEPEQRVAKKYSMTGVYKMNELVRHPSFGFGVVQRVLGARKVEILFESGSKLMRCK